MAPAANLTVRISAQIADLQKEMKAASNTVDRFVGDFDKSITKATIVGTVLGRAIGAIPGFVVGAVKSFTDLTGQLSDLSARTGITIRDLQRFSFAGEQVGVSMEQITQAITQMQNRLVGGDKGAFEALAKLGLTFDQLKQLDPGEQFETIAKRIGAIKSPAEQVNAQIAIFGRGGVVLGPLIKAFSDLVERAEKAGLMSDDLVASGDRLGDSWTRLTRVGSTLIGQVLSPIIPILEKTSEGIQTAVNAYLRLQKIIGDFSTEGFGGGVTTPKVLAQPLSGGAGPVPSISAAEVAKISDALAEQSEAMLEANKAAQDYAESVRELSRDLSGAALQAEVKKLHAAFKQLTPEQLRSALTFDRVGEAAKRLFDEGATLTPELFRILLASQRLTPAVEAAGKEFFEAGKEIKQFHDTSVPMIGVLKGIRAEMEDVIPVEFPPVVADAIRKTEEWRRGLSDLRGALDFLASGSGGGVFGQVVTEIANVVAGMEAGTASARQYEQAITAMQKAAALVAGAGAIAGATGSGSTGGRVAGGALAGASFGSTFGPWGAAIGAGVGALVGLFRGLAAAKDEAKKVNEQIRALKNNLLDTHGGMERLETLAQMVGLSFEAAWSVKGQAGLDLIAKLTDEVTEKQGKLNAAMEEYGFTWEDTGEKFRQLALSDMAQTLLEKTELLKGAGIDYNTILEKQAGQYSELVQAAIRTGTEIPAALRPVIEQLIEMGLLTNEAGEAITDITQVPFAESLTKGFDRVVNKLDELIDKLTNGVGGALDGLSRRRVDIPVDFHYNDPGRVSPEGPGGGIKIEVVTNLDGREVARSVARHMPDELAPVI